jgi:hypothetical protein
MQGCGTPSSGYMSHLVSNRSVTGQERIQDKTRLDPDDSMRNPLAVAIRDSDLAFYKKAFFYL